MDFLFTLQKEWPVIAQAPWSVAAIVLLCMGTGWAVGRFMYGERIAGLKDTIDALKTKIQVQPASSTATHPGAEQYPLPQPYGITKASAERIMSALAGEKLGAFITLDLDASEARNLYSQVVSVFREAGWAVSAQEIMGLNTTPDCGVALLASKDVSDDHLALVRKALHMGGIDFEERSTSSAITVPQIAFTKRDPYWTPPAKWG